ncbi:MAG TPA: hypothetical protein VLZ06_00105 [Solirubrobacteraceae bacterium]|nr:hypothetical protein [Solirubrobacteraceae bacterium]
MTTPPAAKAESVDLFDLWIVEADRRRELTDRIGGVVRQLLAPRPGFVFAQIYESEGNEVLLHVRTRTAADRRAILDLAEDQRAYRELRGMATSHAGFYRLVDSVGSAPSGG